MRLYDISTLAREQLVPDAEISGITDNTAEIRAGDVFVCIKGSSFDGHSVAAEMLEKGAAAVVCEHDLGLHRQIIVSDSRKYFALLASSFYGNPEKKLKIIAVTGTNGKSTIVNIIKHLIEQQGKKCGCIGTVGYDVCGSFYEAHLTTPRQMQLFGYFAEMVANGAEYCAIEASSQALAQNRLYGLDYELGIFTNMTQDHLDYHGTMENYYKAKKSMFRKCKKALVCTDDKYGERLYRELDIPKKSYSITDLADFYSVNIKLSAAHVSYWLSASELEKSYPVKFAIPGRYNVANSLAAVGAAVELGFEIGETVAVLTQFKGIRGRCEVLWDGDFSVICDYAHTPDALEKFLGSIRDFCHKRVICLFGAAGERDETKRADMGKIVGSLADFAVLTSDNPRFEDPFKIIKQVEKGLNKTGILYRSIEQRREAIEFALNEARSGDIVCLCGKGHESYQVYGDEYQHFDEHEIVSEIMNTNNKRKD